MPAKSIEKLVTELLELYERDLCRPFPYADIRKLRRRARRKKRYEGLNPELDMYSYYIASMCGGARQLLQRNLEELRQREQGLQGTFFDEHPKYKPLGGVKQ